MKPFYPLATACCRKIILITLFCFPLFVNAQEMMRANLYVVDGNGATLVDGNLTNYNSIYSNDVDIDDAWKMTNPGFNFGILRSGYDLVVERRNLIASGDTTYFKMWNMQQLNYRIRFVCKNLNHPGLKAVIKDTYLNTETSVQLNDTTYLDFTIDSNPASGDQMRFRLIYSTTVTAPVDVNFTGIQAQRRAGDVIVKWDVASEMSMESYIIEHSLDGRNFNSLQQVSPANHTSISQSYNYLDKNASKTDNFYRIRAISRGGRIQYSPIAKIGAISTSGDIAIYPNPVVNKTMQLLISDQPAGKYALRLLAANGSQIALPSIQITEGAASLSVNLPANITPGIYKIQFICPSNNKIVKTIQVL